MYRFSLAILLTTLAFASVPRAYALQDQPLAVALQCSCSDVTGQAYADAVRRVIREQAGYRLQREDEDAKDGTIVIRVISTGYEAKDGKPHSMLSIVATYEGATMHEVIDATCDQLSVKESAESTVSGLKDLI